jgi:transaldolase
MMKENPLRGLENLGQSVWMDFIRRGMILSGELRQLIEEDGLKGVTSNPSIFEKAIAESNDYDDAILALARQGKSAGEIYEELTVEDIQMTADLFRPCYDRLDGRDGFVSLEVSPHLAHDTGETIAEAHRLWDRVDRPNVMIKVPATLAGLPAIEHLVGEGINVNVTLLFGLPRYRLVADAYIKGLEKRATRREPLKHSASVASFFLSRIDVMVDPILDKMFAGGGRNAEMASSLKGQVAIASAKVASEIHEEIFSGERFRELHSRGARTQRLLWASTSTKNPEYSDVKYVEALIGPNTVNTMPIETLNAYRDHGEPVPRLDADLQEAHRVLKTLSGLGIDLEEVTQRLEDEGVDKFIRPYDQLMETLRRERTAALARTSN